MAGKITNQGLQRMGRNLSFIGTAPGNVTTALTRYVMTMSIDDSTVAFSATDTALNSGGAVTNEYDVLLDATPTISGQTVTHTATIPSGAGSQNFTIKRIALHDDLPANVTTSSSTLVAGSDGQSVLKTASFAIGLVLKITSTDNS